MSDLHAFKLNPAPYGARLAQVRLDELEGLTSCSFSLNLLKKPLGHPFS